MPISMRAVKSFFLGKPAMLSTLLALILLAPFAGKPLHTDDPLFIWTAQHIRAHPCAAFYDFPVNWYGVEMPMAQITKNPPLLCYYLALIGGTLGWGEVTLHLALLPAALAVVLGTYYLAKEFGSSPMLAALATTLSPAFLVSSTSLMCDTTMLAFWVWAVLLWVRGTHHNRYSMLFVGALLAGLCALTKYYGISLVPLLLLYALLQKRRFGPSLLFLIIPIGVLFLYHWLTVRLYGHSLLLDAAAYAAGVRPHDGARVFSRFLVGLSFTGGCTLVPLFVAPMLWPARRIAAGLVLAASVVISLFLSDKLCGFGLHDGHGPRWTTILQIALFACAGLCVLALAGGELLSTRKPEAVFLFCWIVGTFVFATFVNWGLNARSILPIIPAVAIVLASRIACWNPGGSAPVRLRQLPWLRCWPLLAAALVSVAATWADFCVANSSRAAARQIHAQLGRRSSGAWFQGHWGFQYYMQALGYRPLDVYRSKLGSGDLVVSPLTNANTYDLGDDVRLIQVLRLVSSRWITTWSAAKGAGFYSDLFGPLPFSLGQVPPEEYGIFEVQRPVDFPARVCAQHYTEGNALLQKGRIFEALLHYREALLVNYDVPEVLTRVAWILATQPNPQFRDGEQAMKLASRAADLTQRRDPVVLDALAAAYAETGRFTEAIATAKKARELALSAGNTDLAEAALRRLREYEAGRPFREVPP
jgi:hypothetical protein